MHLAMKLFWLLAVQQVPSALTALPAQASRLHLLMKTYGGTVERRLAGRRSPPGCRDCAAAVHPREAGDQRR